MKRSSPIPLLHGRKWLLIMLASLPMAIFLLAHSPAWAAGPNLDIQKIEVTQAIQCLDQTEGYTNMPDNGLELATGRPVTVRVYLTNDGPSLAPGTDPFNPPLAPKVPIRLWWFAHHEDTLPDSFSPNMAEQVFDVPPSKDLNQLRNDERGSATFILDNQPQNINGQVFYPLGDPYKKNLLWIEAEIALDPDPNSTTNPRMAIQVGGKIKQGQNWVDLPGGLFPRAELEVIWVPIYYKPKASQQHGQYTGPNLLQNMNKPLEDVGYMKAIYPMPLFFGQLNPYSPVYLCWYNQPDIRDGAEAESALTDMVKKFRDSCSFLQDSTLVGYLPDDADVGCSGRGGPSGSGTGGGAWVQGGVNSRSSATGASGDAELLAHEVAHTLGIGHIDQSGTMKEPCWPFPGEDMIRETGWSTLSNKPIRSDNYSSWVRDFMTGSGSACWIAPYTWNRLLKKPFSLEWSKCSDSSSFLFNPRWLAGAVTLRRPFQLLSRLLSRLAPQVVWASPGDQPEPVILVSGRIFPDGTGKLSPLYQFDRVGPFPESNLTGRFLIDLKDPNGNVLATHGFDLSPSDALNGSSPTTGGFSLVLPFPSQASWVVLRQGLTVLHEVKASPNKPQVSLSLSSSLDPAAINWTATDLDGDKVYLAIMYSSNGGNAFAPLAMDLETNNTGSLEILSNLLPGSSNSILRLMATDGFNTSFVDSSPFEVSNKPPSVVIHAPQDNAVIDVSKDIIFSGLAYDPEDGNLRDTQFLDGTNLVWESDGDDVLGSGETLVLKGGTLSLGAHEITLKAKDNSGNEVSASVWINVALPVRMDIKPGSYPNSIDPSSKGVIPVAILGSEEFDVTSIDPKSLIFGPQGASVVKYSFADVNADGFLDLISNYRTKDCGFGKEVSMGSLSGKLLDGTPLLGIDSVRIVPLK